MKEEAQIIINNKVDMKNIFRTSVLTVALASFTLVSCETKQTGTAEQGTDGPTTIDATVSESESGKTVAPDAAAEANAAAGTADSAAGTGQSQND